MCTPGDAQVAHDGEHIGKKRNHIETHSLCPPFFCLHRKQACASAAMRPMQVFRLEFNRPIAVQSFVGDIDAMHMRSEEHTSELQSLMRISYAVFCLKKKTDRQRFKPTEQQTLTIRPAHR